jgi:X-Pro dipeptidyl-peptidase
MRTSFTSSLGVVIATAIGVLLAATPATAQQFVNGLAQPVFNVTGSNLITHNVWVEIPDLDTDRDGINDRIRVQIRRPAVTDGGTRLPVVLTASPYSGGQLPYPTYNVHIPLYEPSQTPPVYPPPGPFVPPPPYTGTDPPIDTLPASSYQSYFLPRGFIFADAQSLGTGHSTGCPTIGGFEESLAMKAVIDWFNGRGHAYDVNGNEVTAYWTTGATTMTGVSYDGTLPYAAASTGVDGLKSIVPIAGVTSYYDHRRSYGHIMMSNPTLGTDADTLFTNILTRKHPEVCAYMRDLIVQGEDRFTANYNAWWDERNYVNFVGQFRAAVLIEQGTNDLNVKPRNMARMWQALTAYNVPRKMWLNTGGHGDNNNSSNQAAWRDELNRFWSNTLFGIDNGALDGPKVKIQRSSTVWTDYADWPVPGAEATNFNFEPSGNNSIGFLGLARARSSAFEVIVDNSAIAATTLAAAAQSPNRLLYKTAPLIAPVHVSGIPVVWVRMSFNGPAAVVSAMLIQYAANGTATIITRGWANPQNRTSLTEKVAVVPGTFYKMQFELQPHDYVFPAGSRIGLMLLSSDNLFTLQPPPGAVLTLDTVFSGLTLPVVGGAQAFASATN